MQVAERGEVQCLVAHGSGRGRNTGVGQVHRADHLAEGSKGGGEHLFSYLVSKLYPILISFVPPLLFSFLLSLNFLPIFTVPNG